MLRNLVASVTLLAATCGGAALASAPSDLNAFEWSAVAPTVVVAEPLGEKGRYHEVRVTRVFRGDVEAGATLRVDLRRANRNRLRTVDPKPLRLEADTPYLLLLEPRPPRRPKAPPYHAIVRGVHGARELPAEGAPAFLEAFRTLIEIQALKSDVLTWERMTALLDESNPILIRTGLQQFVKFRRGRAELVPSVHPLLEHPDPEIRREAAELAGQILTRPEEIPDPEPLRAALIGHARRDESVPVRVTATSALGEFEDETVYAVLEEIARTDPNQEVRYVAEKILLVRRREAERVSG